MSDKESERLRRLREKQLAQRDPMVKQKKFQHDSSVKEKRMQKPFSFSKAWKDLPHIFKAPFYGLLLGILLIIVLPNLWSSPYAMLVGAGLTVVFMIFGLVAGMSFDLRDNIKNNIK
jgi:hypothetical protein